MRARLAKLTAFFLVVAPSSPAQTNAPNPEVWTVPQVVRDINQIKQGQYTAFNPHYLEERSDIVARFRPVTKQIFLEETAGKEVQCAHQIFEEIFWLITSSADVNRMNERLRDLETNLVPAASNEINKAAGPNCVTEWWWRLPD